MTLRSFVVVSVSVLNFFTFFRLISSNKYNQNLYNAVNQQTFQKYTEEWNRFHQNWVNINLNEHMCRNFTEVPIFPVCYQDQQFIPDPSHSFGPQNPPEKCFQVQCIRKINDKCTPTPADTLEYLPPQPENLLNDFSICSYDGPDAYISTYSYGFEQGIPPLAPAITPTRLTITGNIFGAHNHDQQCLLLSKAKIIAWQLNPLSLTKVTNVADQTKETISDHVQEPSPEILSDPRNDSTFSLRDNSCVAVQYSLANGSYSFHTLVPPSYGSPRSIFFQITMDGYETLTTRLYFDKDTRLQELTTLGNREGQQESTSQRVRHGFKEDQFDLENTVFPGAVAQDPRVAKVHFYATDPRGFVENDLIQGYLHVNHDFTLSPKRMSIKPNHAAPAVPLTDIDGIWSEDNTGTFLSIKTYGNYFIAKELPHAKNWGVISGYLSDNTMKGMNFMNQEIYQQLVETHRKKSLLPKPRTPVPNLLMDGSSVYPDEMNKNDDDATVATMTPLTESLLETVLSVQSSSLMTGVIVSSDASSTVPFNSVTNNPELIEEAKTNENTRNPLAATIIWTTNPLQDDLTARRIWRRQDNTLDKGYRYIKVVITRVMNDKEIHPATTNTDGYQTSTGELIINEIQFFEGYFHENEVPDRSSKMRSPRYPVPLLVTCSSFTTQDNHCYKAFDGDRNSSSSWRTTPIRSKNNNLSPNQWILLDLGEGHGIRPTGLRIVCDVANAIGSQTARGCPMTFSIQVSHDNVKFDVVYKEDLYNYSDLSPASHVNPYYGRNGKMFYFVAENSKGRNNGDSCGSCDLGPLFQCALDSYDSLCHSRYCNQQGYCDSPPICPAGQYLDVVYHHYHQLSYQCRLCPAGRYGSEEGMRSPYCSGVCQEGFYCPEGSTSAQQIACGGYQFYCPRGSSFPLPAPSGKKTLSILPTEADDPTIGNGGGGMNQYRTVDCSLGHYCIQGVEYPCPLGQYGNITGLQVSSCSSYCPAGNYCPSGSIIPTKCPNGHYCPDGKVFLPCPAGRYGDREGLGSPDCSGLCAQGHYCLEGSISATDHLCPAGYYGDIHGLTNKNCSGLCLPGYYCPTGTIHSQEHSCGNPEVYCPLGSSQPLTVSPGYYSVGGSADETTRFDQMIAHKGFFALEGIEYPCPAGTFGNRTGLNANDDLTNVPVYTHSPTLVPTSLPSKSPFLGPTKSPTFAPTNTASPTVKPTFKPTFQPTVSPTADNGLTDIDYRTTGSPTLSPTREEMFMRKHFYCTGNIHYFHSSVFAVFYWFILISFFLVGLCSPGYYCPTNSTSFTQFPCPAGRYGSEPGLPDDSCTSYCPLGHYCPEGSVRPTPCPAGVFGGFTGLTDETCSKDCSIGVTHCNQETSLCSPGYYCPSGSIIADQYECGEPDYYCPLGSSEPQAVADGFYSVDEEGSNTDHPNTRSDQKICEE
jgi:hypothetical protein